MSRRPSITRKLLRAMQDATAVAAQSNCTRREFNQICRAQLWTERMLAWLDERPHDKKQKAVQQ